MNKIQKTLIAIGLAIIAILSIRLMIHKETVYTSVAEVQLIRDDPKLKIETLDDEIGMEGKSQKYIQTNHNQQAK